MRSQYLKLQSAALVALQAGIVVIYCATVVGSGFAQSPPLESTDLRAHEFIDALYVYPRDIRLQCRLSSESATEIQQRILLKRLKPVANNPYRHFDIRPLHWTVRYAASLDGTSELELTHNTDWIQVADDVVENQRDAAQEIVQRLQDALDFESVIFEISLRSVFSMFEHDRCEVTNTQRVGEDLFTTQFVCKDEDQYRMRFSPAMETFEIDFGEELLEDNITLRAGFAGSLMKRPNSSQLIPKVLYTAMKRERDADWQYTQLSLVPEYHPLESDILLPTEIRVVRVDGYNGHSQLSYDTLKLSSCRLMSSAIAQTSNTKSVRLAE